MTMIVGDSAYAWSLQPQVLLAVPLAAAVYAWRFHDVHAGGAPPRARDWVRAAAFGAGLIVILAALVSPIDTLGEERLFSVHMAQHLLLADIAPILLLVGLTRPILRPLVRRVRPIEQRLGPLAHPAAALAFAVGTIWLWHLPGLYELALDHYWAHLLEHAAFFTAGIAFWWYVIEPVPPRHPLEGMAMLGYVGAAKLLLGALGLVLTFSSSAFYDTYEQAPRTWGLTPLQDLNAGGLVMMLEQSIVLAAFFAILFARMIERSEREQRRRERLGAAD